MRGIGNPPEKFQGQPIQTKGTQRIVILNAILTALAYGILLPAFAGLSVLLMVRVINRLGRRNTGQAALSKWHLTSTRFGHAGHDDTCTNPELCTAAGVTLSVLLMNLQTGTLDIGYQSEGDSKRDALLVLTGLVPGGEDGRLRMAPLGVTMGPDGIGVNSVLRAFPAELRDTWHADEPEPKENLPGPLLPEVFRSAFDGPPEDFAP